MQSGPDNIDYYMALVRRPRVFIFAMVPGEPVHTNHLPLRQIMVRVLGRDFRTENVMVGLLSTICFAPSLRKKGFIIARLHNRGNDERPCRDKHDEHVDANERDKGQVAENAARHSLVRRPSGANGRKRPHANDDAQHGKGQLPAVETSTPTSIGQRQYTSTMATATAVLVSWAVMKPA